MIIKELQIMSFGKFHNVTIPLHEGMNIIYGENETGKSTVHKFIEGMFFGFFKDQKSRRIYSEDYKKYLPFEGENYGGTILFTQGDQEIRIERNLLKGKDHVVIYNNTTGEDITAQYDYDRALKLPIPFDLSTMNRTIYNNTINISQLGNATQGELIHQLKDRLANYGQSKSDISVKNAIKSLTMQKNEYGTEKRKGSPLYQEVNKRDELIQEKKESIQNENQIKELVIKKDEIQDKIDLLLNTKQQYIKNLEAIQSHISLQKLEQYKELEKKNKIYQHEKDTLQIKKVSKDDFDEIVNFESQIHMLKENKDAVQVKMKATIDEESEIQEKMPTQKNHSSNTVLQDHHQLQFFVNQKTTLTLHREGSNTHLLQDKIKEQKYKQKFFNIAKIASLIVGLIGSIAGFWQSLFFLLAPFLILSGYLYYISKKISESIKIHSNDLSSMNEKDNNVQNELLTLEKNIHQILQKYGCKDYPQFMEVLTNVHKENERKESLLHRYQVLKDRKKNYQQDLDQYKFKIIACQDEIKSLLQKNDVRSKEIFFQIIQNNEQYESINNKIIQNTAIMDNVIKDEEYNDVLKDAEKYKELKPWLKIQDIQLLQEELKALNDKIEQHHLEKYHIEGKIENMMASNKLLSEIETELTYAENEINKIENKLASIQLAIDVIGKISEEIHNELAPEINESLGTILNKITNKYTQVKVTKDLDIKIEDPYRQRLLSVDNLSLGTVDQVYFAFRLGLNSFLQGQQFPLILDEPFILYDDNRLKNVLVYLIEYIKERQIILFTSQKREEEIICKLKKPVHVIDLDEETVAYA